LFAFIDSREGRRGRPKWGHALLIRPLEMSRPASRSLNFAAMLQPERPMQQSLRPSVPVESF